MGGYWEPMVGVYSKSISEKWKQSIADGEFKLQKLIKKFDYKLLNVEKDLHAKEFSFLNVNSPDDLLKAEKWIK